MMMSRRRFLQAAATVSGATTFPQVAWPQSYPVRPVRVIITVAGWPD